MKNKYEITVASGSGKQIIEAHSLRADAGGLTFVDEAGDIIAIFPTGYYSFVKRVSEPATESPESPTLPESMAAKYLTSLAAAYDANQDPMFEKECDADE